MLPPADPARSRLQMHGVATMRSLGFVAGRTRRTSDVTGGAESGGLPPLLAALEALLSQKQQARRPRLGFTSATAITSPAAGRERDNPDTSPSPLDEGVDLSGWRTIVVHKARADQPVGVAVAQSGSGVFVSKVRHTHGMYVR